MSEPIADSNEVHPKKLGEEILEPNDTAGSGLVHPFTWSEFASDTIWSIKSLFNNPDFSGLVVFPLWIAESIINETIILKVPYTEIDYSTYMQQIDQIEKGQLDYSKVVGDTGPIVYPGGYVWIYSWMKFITDGTDDLRAGQEVFRFLYLGTLLLIFVCYFLTNSQIKPYSFYLLLLSKRLHSIYVLRLFNDCFATFFSVATILTLQVAAKVKKPGERVAFFLCLFAADLLAVAISIKMNALLYLPGFLLITYFLCDENLVKTLLVSFFGLVIEIGMNSKFLFTQDSEIRNQFIANAFNFDHQFLYEWTVNWKFLPEEIFSAKSFQYLLLSGHVAFLLLFLFRRWIDQKSITGKSVSLFLQDAILRPHRNTINPGNIIFSRANSANFVMWVMTLSNLIGVLFSRSLHYQFLCWYFFSLPYLLHTTGLPAIVTIGLFAAHEWCWDTFPATAQTSFTLVVVLTIIVVANYFSNPLQKKEVSKKSE
ncbi:DEKNAAC103378 [Brettanomyces naardenensis]|uniref:Dol-P-Man:Man(5)GlcNAc(2)-PP-Dol alpha-1,3-mannosyltransferase n=1 Tax=Brettanomyces naardenensis TaxID=13370 RepID=A0A448YNV7_BRENA|nr:DEKNAAC103378 [Brettanomyces naardenensis]